MIDRDKTRKRAPTMLQRLSHQSHSHTTFATTPRTTCRQTRYEASSPAGHHATSTASAAAPSGRVWRRFSTTVMPVLSLVISLVLSLALPGVAVAMPSVSGTTITLPTDPGWYQVQNASTFESICEGQISVCDVTPGTYIVINHTSSERFENIVVNDPGSTTPPTTPTASFSVTHVSLTCTALHQGFNAPANCTLSCPGGGIAIGASCEARWAFITPNHVLGTSTALQPAGVRCSLTSAPDFVPTVSEGSFPTAEFTGHLACLTD